MPEPDDATAAAASLAVVRAGIELAPWPRAYTSGWRRAGLLEAVNAKQQLMPVGTTDAAEAPGVGRERPR